MADIIKVKAKKNFQWDQDNKYIYVKVNMPGHTSIKNLQIYLSDLVLRITSKQKKSVETLDLLKQVDYLSAQNKFVLIDGVINATLKKKNPTQKWDALLIQDISLAELKNRRKQSEARYQNNIKQAQELKQKLKVQYDRLATKQLMKFQQQERKKLDKKKQDQKQAALNQVFRNVNQKTGKIQYQQKKWIEKGLKDLQKLQKQELQQQKKQIQAKKKILEQKSLKQLQRNKKEIKQQQNQKNTSKKNDIFSQSDIKQQQEMRNNVIQHIEQIPIRKQAKVNLKFTQKIYPNVATRDYHYTQPPMPKGATPLPPPRQGDLENRNPLWLKDRGDAFFKNKNYSAALDAYDQAIKLDPSQRKIFMNRSITHMKLLNFDSAINDCQIILLQMQKQLVNNQQNKEDSLKDLIKIKVRKALCLAWKGKLKQSNELLSQQLSFPVQEQVRQQIQQCLSAIRSRQQSHMVKIKADQFVKRQNYNEAIGLYDKAIQIDNNQYALSNKTLCLNKIQNFQQSLKTSDQGVKIIEDFLMNASNNNKSNIQYTGILIKLLYRKANALESLKMNKQAEQALKKALNLNPEDKDIKLALDSVKARQSSQLFTKLKQQAGKNLTNQNSNPALALQLYSKCLKLVQGPQKVHQYLSILQNQCVCYLKLNQFDNIIATSIRILTITNNLKNKIVQFGEKKNNVLTHEMINKIILRTLMRRANAYLQIGQVYNAKADLQRAQQIDPNQKTVQNQLNKLRNSIST